MVTIVLTLEVWEVQMGTPIYFGGCKDPIKTIKPKIKDCRDDNNMQHRKMTSFQEHNQKNLQKLERDEHENNIQK